MDSRGLFVFLAFLCVPRINAVSNVCSSYKCWNRVTRKFKITYYNTNIDF